MLIVCSVQFSVEHIDTSTYAYFLLNLFASLLSNARYFHLVPQAFCVRASTSLHQRILENSWKVQMDREVGFTHLGSILRNSK